MRTIAVVYPVYSYFWHFKCDRVRHTGPYQRYFLYAVTERTVVVRSVDVYAAGMPYVERNCAGSPRVIRMVSLAESVTPCGNT